jgi:hypothetical protein
MIGVSFSQENVTDMGVDARGNASDGQATAAGWDPRKGRV